MNKLCPVWPAAALLVTTLVSPALAIETNIHSYVCQKLDDFTATVDGIPCAVFEMTYKDRDEDTSHCIVYIDPRTKVVRKREAYSQQGKRQATYYYKDLKEVVPGIWFPTRLEAENIDHVISGVTG